MTDPLVLLKEQILVALLARSLPIGHVLGTLDIPITEFNAMGDRIVEIELIDNNTTVRLHLKRPRKGQ